MDQPQIPLPEFNQPIPKTESEPLPLLPEREWLRATIVMVKYQIAMFQGQPQTLKDRDGNEILRDGQPIHRKEFDLTFEYDDYRIPNTEEPRKSWLRLGASLGEKAHLPKFLANVVPENSFETPNDVINALQGREVQLQLSNKMGKNQKMYQNVIYDAVRVISSPDMDWKE